MPFTPFHFGAHACAVLPFRKKLDVPVFLLANVIVDIEPLMVMTFGLAYPLHGYVHTFLGGAVAGSFSGVIAYILKRPLSRVMGFLGLPYASRLSMSIVSGVLGAWLHIVFDAPIYSDIRPFYPAGVNPLYGFISPANEHFLCALFFIPAIILYLMARKTSIKKILIK